MPGAHHSNSNPPVTVNNITLGKKASKKYNALQQRWETMSDRRKRAMTQRAERPMPGRPRAKRRAIRALTQTGRFAPTESKGHHGQ